MSSSLKMNIGPANTGLWRLTQSEEAAERVTMLMQQDMERHHVFLNDIGFHDHMPHHLLALYGTGASVENIQQAWDYRHPLQRSVVPSHDSVVSDLIQSWDGAAPYLGQEQYYPDFLAYFQKAIADQGYEAVVNNHVFSANDPAQMLVRLHAGVLHPLIQLMFGLEWKQPAVVAEALAQTAVHGVEHLNELLLEGEKLAESSSQESPMPSILSLYNSIKDHPHLAHTVDMKDEEKIVDGVLGRNKEAMLAILKQVKVHPDELAERTAEMFHDIILVASGAAIHPPHHVKYDFFLMHHLNSTLIYLTINDQPWISTSNKIRMLEWKIRMDLIQYTARGAPAFSIEDIVSYQPKAFIPGTLRDMAGKLHAFGDDGHGIKQARATCVCHELTKNYQGRPWVMLEGDDVWKQIQHMVIDALEAPGPLYVRTAGLEEAWKDIPPQSAPKRSVEELQARP